MCICTNLNARPRQDRDTEHCSRLFSFMQYTVTKLFPADVRSNIKIRLQEFHTNHVALINMHVNILRDRFLHYNIIGQKKGRKFYKSIGGWKLTSGSAELTSSSAGEYRAREGERTEGQEAKIVPELEPPGHLTFR